MGYLDKMKALIYGWREIWGEGDFLFYYVQLAPHVYSRRVTTQQLDPYALPTFGNAQRRALSIAQTGMVGTIDIGDVESIHPKNKRDVGKRLAAWALARTCGRKGIAYSESLFKGMSIEGERVRVSFEHTDGGLRTYDGATPQGFEVAGKDGDWAAAEASIDGEEIIVRSKRVATPVAVRFAWHETGQHNLINVARLPASPFSAREKDGD